MSVSRLSDILAYAPDLNKHRNEILKTIRQHEEMMDRVSRLRAVDHVEAKHAIGFNACKVLVIEGGRSRTDL